MSFPKFVTLVAVVGVLVITTAFTSAALAARWKICAGTASSITCNTLCGYVIASFPTYEECAEAKKKIRLPPNKVGNSGKSAGAAGMAECRKRYGKTVTNAMLAKDGKTLICHYRDPAFSGKDPVAVRDACKKHFGPVAQIVRQSGKWYCRI